MARTNNVWQTGTGGTYIQTISPTGFDILINGSNRYLNFNNVVGSTGYGFRDNGGVMEFKNSGGAWTAVGSGGGGGSQTPWTSDINAAGFALNGNTTANGILFLSSTSNATKGAIQFGTASEYDELNDRLGIGTLSPQSKIEVKTTALATTPTSSAGIALTTAGAAALGAQQISNVLRMTGFGWSTTNSNSQAVDFYSYVLPVQGAASPSGTYRLDYSINGGAVTNLLALTTAGQMSIGGQLIASFGSGQTGIYTASALGLGFFNNNGGVSHATLTNIGNWSLTPAGLTGAQATTAFSLVQSWNTSASPTLIFANVTTGTSGASSLLMDLQYVSVSQMSLTKGGALTIVSNMSCNNLLASTFVRAGAASGFQWNGRSFMSSSADGLIMLSNAALNDFSRLQFGGTTSSFPSLKRSSAALIARLADDSADADFTASRLISTAVVRLKGYTVATLPAGTIGDTAYVTDALAPTYLGVLTGGGAINTPVFFNGTAWVSY